jgi:hypothetical protein
MCDIYVDSFITFQNTIKVTCRKFNTVSTRKAMSPCRDDSETKVLIMYVEHTYRLLVLSLYCLLRLLWVRAVPTSIMNVTYQDGLYTLSAGVSVSMPLQSSAARDLPWSECSLITTVWTGPVLRHLLIRDNTNSKVAGILMPRLGFEPTLLVICGRRQLG